MQTKLDTVVQLNYWEGSISACLLLRIKVEFIKHYITFYSMSGFYVVSNWNSNTDIAGALVRKQLLLAPGLEMDCTTYQHRGGRRNRNECSPNKQVNSKAHWPFADSGCFLHDLISTMASALNARGQEPLPPGESVLWSLTCRQQWLRSKKWVR